jgi:hypothetical protein
VPSTLGLDVFTEISHVGGNVDVMDEDGDTPLYTVENIDTARWLVEHGATVHHQNNEGVSVSFIPANGYNQMLMVLSPLQSL